MNQRLRDLCEEWEKITYILNYDDPSEGEPERLSARSTEIEWELQKEPATDREEVDMKLHIMLDFCRDDDDPLPGLTKSLHADLHRVLQMEEDNAA